MRLLLQDQDDVTLKHVRYLLTLSFVNYFLAVCSSAFDISDELFRLNHYFATSASWAVFFIHSSLSLAFVARLLCLHLHESHVLNHFDDALALAFSASFCLASLGTGTFTFLAVYVPVDGEFLAHAVVQLLKSHLEVYFTFRSFHAIIASAFISLHLIFSLLIINLPLNLVGQNFTRTIDSCELLCSIFVT